MCCKRRVLDFDDFLKIQGCKTGRHVFAKKTRTGATVSIWKIRFLLLCPFPGLCVLNRVKSLKSL